MEDESEFDWVIGKVPRHDKEGNAITGHKLAGGGYHRDDGTYSGVAYDLEHLGDAPEHVSYPLRDAAKEAIATAVAEILVEVLRIAVAAIIAKSVPPVKSWWFEKAVPSLKQRWDRLRKLVFSGADGDTGKAAGTELAALSKISPADLSKEMDLAFEKYRTSISSAEAQERRLAIQIAEAFIAEQKRKLSNARIEDYDYFLELTSTVEQLTTQQVSDRINLMLERSAPLLDNDSLTEFPETVGGGRIIDGEYLPTRNKEAREALHLTNSEMPYLHETNDVEMPEEDTTGRI